MTRRKERRAGWFLAREAREDRHYVPDHGHSLVGHKSLDGPLQESQHHQRTGYSQSTLRARSRTRSPDRDANRNDCSRRARSPLKRTPFDTYSRQTQNIYSPHHELEYETELQKRRARSLRFGTRFDERQERWRLKQESRGNADSTISRLMRREEESPRSARHELKHPNSRHHHQQFSGAGDVNIKREDFGTKRSVQKETMQVQKSRCIELATSDKGTECNTQGDSFHRAQPKAIVVRSPKDLPQLIYFGDHDMHPARRALLRGYYPDTETDVLARDTTSRLDLESPRHAYRDKQKDGPVGKSYGGKIEDHDEDLAPSELQSHTERAGGIDEQLCSPKVHQYAVPELKRESESYGVAGEHSAQEYYYGSAVDYYEWAYSNYPVREPVSFTLKQVPMAPSKTVRVGRVESAFFPDAPDLVSISATKNAEQAARVFAENPTPMTESSPNTHNSLSKVMATRKSPFNLATCARSNILALKPYRCARDDYKDDGTNILLDANENAYGPALALNQNGRLSDQGANSSDPEVDLLGLNRYPDPHQIALKQLFCNLRNTHVHTTKTLTPEHMFAGVGSDEAIDALLRVFCRPGTEKILTCPPTYGMYKVSAAVNDISIVSVPLSAIGFQLQPELVNEALAKDPLIKIVYICSPGNPTGALIKKEDIQKVLEHPTWNGVVVLDEAYIDFASEGSSLAEWVTEWPNLVVMQTLSKGFGLAGIRLGVAFSSPEIATLLNNLKAPYNISNPTSQLAQAALQGNHFLVMTNNLSKILEQRDRLIRELPQISGVGRFLGGFDANFLLIEMLDKPNGCPSNEVALKVYETLAEARGVVVRFRGTENGCNGCLRISVGTESECTRFLAELNSVLQNIYSQQKNGRSPQEQQDREVAANNVVA